MREAKSGRTTMQSLTERMCTLPSEVAEMIWRRAAIAYLLAAKKVAARRKSKAIKLHKRLQEQPPVMLCTDGGTHGFYRWPSSQRLFKAPAPLGSLRRALKGEGLKWKNLERYLVAKLNQVK